MLCKSGCWDFANRVYKRLRESGGRHAESSARRVRCQEQPCTTVVPSLVTKAPAFAPLCKRRRGLRWHWASVQTGAKRRTGGCLLQDVALESNFIRNGQSMGSWSLVRDGAACALSKHSHFTNNRIVGVNAC